MTTPSIFNAVPTGSPKSGSSSKELLSCYDIELFHANQHQLRNPKYNDLLASIEAKGVQTPIQVTFYPQSQKLGLSLGEQTRLVTNRELYERTQDSRFLYPPILKETVLSDFGVCINHVLENQQRSNSPFLETSKAIVTIKDLLIQEPVDTNRETLAVEMASRGLPIRRQTIQGMLWFHEITLILINKVLLKNVTRPIIDKIRSLRIALKRIIDSDYCDSTLIELINHHRGDISSKKIKAHFQKQKTERVTDSRSSSIVLGIEKSLNKPGLVQMTRSAAAGVPIDLSTVEDGQREGAYLLAEPPGALIDDTPEQVIIEMGLADTRPTRCELVAAAKQRFGIQDTDLNSNSILNSSDDVFQALGTLITETRQLAQAGA